MANEISHPLDTDEYGCFERADDRRDFLKKAAAMSVGITADSKAASKSTRSIPAGPQVIASKMPMIQVAGTSMSRLILGANQMWGYSHRGKLLSKLMTDWYSSERVVEVLHHAEACGINTWQSSVSGRLVHDWQQYKAQGGGMNLLLLAAPGKDRPGDDVAALAKLDPLAVIHHGQHTDRLWRENRADDAKDYLKRIRDAGMKVGCSTHNPETLRYIEDKRWDVDFYLTAFYRISKRRNQWKEELGWQPQHEIYPQGMPDEMTAMIRQIPKPCLCYKVHAAGRLCDQPKQVEAGFKYALESIKPSDGIIIGMFPRFEDQVAINANHTIKYGHA